MSQYFTTLVRSYAGQLLLLTRRLYKCSPSSVICGIPTFIVNQVSLVLALLLPLKVIIMLGSDGVPRYFRSFMSEATREPWMLGLAGAAVGMFLLHLATARLLTWLANRGGGRVLDRSQKTVLFDNQQRFASDIFERVIATWGTIGMALGGLFLGFLLEWRLVLLVVAAIALEFALFAFYWNRSSAPERSEKRERLVANRTSVLQNLSAVNVLLLFGGLVYLLLTDPAMNFIVAVLLFLLTRQVLARSVRIFADANFFVRNRERVDALVHPGRHLREERTSERDSFEYLLSPERRGRVFEAVAGAAGAEVADREWQWRDTVGKRCALFVSSAGNSHDSEYWLKLTVRRGDAGLAREAMFHGSDSARALGLSCELVHAGSTFGRGYLLLRSGALSSCPADRLREMIFHVRMRLWRHSPDKELSSKLMRSFPPLDSRLTSDRICRIRLACNGALEERLLDEFLHRLPDIVAVLQRLPKVLCNKALLERDNILLDSSGFPVVMHWEAIRIDIVGADLAPADLDREYSPNKILDSLGNEEMINGALPDWSVPFVANAAQLDQSIERGLYGAALKTLPTLLDMLGRASSAPMHPRSSTLN